jgi:hypothetical protein
VRYVKLGSYPSFLEGLRILSSSIPVQASL